MLTAVDVVGRPADPGSAITCIRQTLSSEQRTVQHRFDAWVDSHRDGPGLDFLLAAVIDGADAMNDVADIVAPMVGALS